jgi:hypothetical protein
MGKKYYYRFVICILWLTVGACASLPPNQDLINGQLDLALKAAQARYDEGLISEAAILTEAVRRIDPDYEGVSELKEKTGVKGVDVTNRGWLGSNRRVRTKANMFFGRRLIFYIPDRLFDALDVLSFDVHFGLGAFANVHATRAVQAGAGVRSKVGMGPHFQRSLGLAAESEMGVAALGLGVQTFAGSMFGTSGTITGGDSLAGLHLPKSNLYQEYRDYWAVGADVTAGFVGVAADIHLMQIFDFIGGLLFIDFARDDLGTTRGLKLDSMETELLRSLSKIEREKMYDKDTSAEKVEEVEKEEPAPSEEDKEPAEEVEEVEKEEPAPSEKDKESAEEKKE